MPVESQCDSCGDSGGHRSREGRGVSSTNSATKQRFRPPPEPPPAWGCPPVRFHGPSWICSGRPSSGRREAQDLIWGRPWRAGRIPSERRGESWRSAQSARTCRRARHVETDEISGSGRVVIQAGVDHEPGVSQQLLRIDDELLGFRLHRVRPSRLISCMRGVRASQSDARKGIASKNGPPASRKRSLRCASRFHSARRFWMSFRNTATS